MLAVDTLEEGQTVTLSVGWNLSVSDTFNGFALEQTGYTGGEAVTHLGGALQSMVFKGNHGEHPLGFGPSPTNL